MASADLELVRRIAGQDRYRAVVTTTRPDGSVHASLVNAGVLADPVSGELCVGLVVEGNARKLAHFRRTGRAAVVFHAGWEWVAVEGPVRIYGPDDNGLPAGGVPQLLRDVFTAAGGTHDDWPEYDRVMAAQRRAAVLVVPARITSRG